MEYKIHLSQFDGPLDLLLHLIEQAELDINEIFVSEITAQYLSYMDEADSLDMDAASAFLAMAANLVYIKSRQLLPRPPQEDVSNEEGQEDPAVLLMNQLREYKAFKAVSKELDAAFVKNSDARTRLPEDIPLPPQRFVIGEVTQQGLYEAFLSILKRTEREDELIELHDVHQDVFTIRFCLKNIRSTLRASNGPISFESLFPEKAEKMQVIVTFMALLEMINHGEVCLQQEGPFSRIFVSANNLRDEAQAEKDNYMDEEPE